MRYKTFFATQVIENRNKIPFLTGSETSAAVNCPDDILGNYDVEYTDVDGNSIAGSQMDSCNDTTLMVFNNSDSNTKLAFTSKL